MHHTAPIAWTIISAIALYNEFVHAAPVVRYNCDPCLDRSGYSVRAIVHGTESEFLWKQIKSSAFQSAKDMGVNFQMDLGSSFNPDQMAKDIKDVADRAKAGKSDVPDTLVVTIPTDAVAAAVKEVVDAGVPVLGLNSGGSVAKSNGVLDFVESDNKQGGIDAAKEMVSILSQSGKTIQKALFVIDEDGNMALDERLNGFKDELGANVVTKLVVDGTSASDMSTKLASTLSGCPYDAVLLSGTRSLPHAIAAYKSAGCTLSDHPLGVFDTSKKVFDAIGADELSFAVGQQQTLQGALTVHNAALYATTGKSLALPVKGAYISGPKLYTKATLPSDTLQTCENDSWPVCPNTNAPNGGTATCNCIERPKIKIGGVTHGVTTDSFWDPVYAASAQAALDLGVELINERLPPEEDEVLLHSKMAKQMLTLCEQGGIAGLFVSIPSDAVKSAIQTCLDLNIPVMSINAGADASKTMGLMHHIGMLEYNAGFGAGEFLAKRGINQAFCINHAKGVNVVEERCAGFKTAVEAAGVTYIGQVYVPHDNAAQYIEIVETFVDNETGKKGNWEGIGILATGTQQHIPVIALQARHNKAVIGSFDTSTELFEALDAGIKEFGIDQQPYLQGYMPVLLLTHAVSTEQNLSNQIIESGPAFIQTSPSSAQVVCEEKMFETCPKTAATETGSAPATSGGDQGKTNTGLIVGLCVIAAAFLVGIGFLAYRVDKLNKHVAELESQGEAIPDLSFSQKMSSVVKPVEQIVKPGGEAA